MMIRHARAGFTFVELIIAMTIVLILGAVTVPAFMSYIEKANISSTRSNLGTIDAAIEFFRNDMRGRYPTKLRDLVERPKDETLARNWLKGGYIKGGELPQDAWGEDFVYKRTPEGKHPYELYSYGPNGAGSEKSEWLSVWDKQ